MTNEQYLRIKNGDESLFNAIYKDHYVALCRYSFQFLHDKEASEEIVDDVFMYIWNHRETIVFSSSVSAYLFGLVRNRSISELNTAKRRYEKHFSNISQSQVGRFLDFVFQDNKSPLSDILDKEFNEFWQESINSLPEQTRKVWLLSREKRLKYQEIADMLGISVNTVKYHIKQASKLLSSDVSKYLIIVVVATQYVTLN